MIPIVVYGSKSVSLRFQDRRTIEVFEMMCVRNMCGTRRSKRVNNLAIRERCELNVVNRVESNILK